MPNLDGTEKLKHVPFDAHDQVVRNPDPNGHYDDAGNFVPNDEFPKAVDHVPHPDPQAAAKGQLEPVVVESPAEERDALRAEIDKLKADNADLKGKIEALAAAAKDASEHAAEVEASEVK